MTISPSAEGVPVVLDATQTGLSVSRTALTDRLSTADWATVVLLSGPAGAGKSTLAHQWATIEGRPHARLRLAAHLDEPAALADAVVGALEAVGPSEPLARAVLTGQEPTFSSVVLPGIAAIASTRATSYVLVLDDLHLLRHPDCIRVVRTLADSVPVGSMLALLSREAAPSWLARLRAEQRLLELTADDLAFDAEELDGLLDLLGISLRPADREALLDRTEGWAVALYLEALALRKSRRIVPRQGEPRMSSDVSFVGDYIQTEILDAVPRETREFLLRTSILDDINPDACDALLDRTDSRQVLEALRRSTPLVTPFDAECTSYRYHHLLHDTLRSLMANTSDTALVVTLHSRAADWYERTGDIDSAVRHSRHAGDLDSTAALIWPHVVFSVASGRPDRLARWLDELTPDEVSSNRWLSMAAAWSALQSADRDTMRRWILRSEAHAGRDWQRRVAVDDYAASLATLEAIEGQLSLEDGAHLGMEALRGLNADDPWRCVAAFISAVCLTLLRDPRGMPLLLEAQSLARALGVHLLEADALAWRGVLALLAGDVTSGTLLVAESTALVQRHNLERFVTSANSFTAQALADSVRPDRDRAALALATARRLTVAGNGIAPWFQVCGRLVQARAALNLGDGALARLLLSEARAQMTPDLAGSAAQDMLEATEAALQVTINQGGSVAAITAAEMRVLQFLPSHLTFPQIGEHVFLSGTTVKTHALSIYRKLGATSRDEAVTRARLLGLVEAPMRI